MESLYLLLGPNRGKEHQETAAVIKTGNEKKLWKKVGWVDPCTRVLQSGKVRKNLSR